MYFKGVEHKISSSLFAKSCREKVNDESSIELLLKVLVKHLVFSLFTGISSYKLPSEEFEGELEIPLDDDGELKFLIFT